MSLKQSVLQMLEQNRDIHFSGQELAARFTVSRAAVWKVIQELKKEGYQLDAVPNKGYKLASGTDLLSAEGIRPYLKPEYSSQQIIFFKSIDSTNQEAKRQITGGAAHGTVIVADNQISGRGRMGRNFFSPAGTGTYLSVIFRPRMNVTKAVLITSAAAVAVCRAIEKMSPYQPQIKWVNDIYLNGRKICGILTEAVTDFESGMVESIIVGIGLNIKTQTAQFPDELQETAGALFTSESPWVTRNQLTAEIINELLDIYQELDQRAFLIDYKQRSMVLGKDVYLYRNKQWEAAKALDIDQNGGLIVENTQGKQETLSSGEISLRLKP